jgi:hypothetical protein
MTAAVPPNSVVCLVHAIGPIRPSTVIRTAVRGKPTLRSARPRMAVVAVPGQICVIGANPVSSHRIGKVEAKSPSVLALWFQSNCSRSLPAIDAAPAASSPRQHAQQNTVAEPEVMVERRGDVEPDRDEQYPAERRMQLADRGTNP